MNGIILPGEKIEAVCENCQQYGPATYGYGTLQLKSGVRVDKVMRAVCDRCGEVVEVAQQSAHRIGDAKRRSYVKKNFRLPQPLKDYAEVKALAITGETRGAVELLIRVSLRTAQRSARHRKILMEALNTVQDPILSLPSDTPETILLPEELNDEVEVLRRDLKGLTQSALFRALLVISESGPISKELQAIAKTS